MKAQYQIDSDGSMVAYNNPYDDITVEQVNQAQQIEEEILQKVGLIETSYIQIGALLAKFKEEKLYLAANFASFQLWCESPNLSRIGYRSAMRLIQIVNEALPILAKHDATNLVAELGMSTMADLLPVLNDDNGEEKFIEAANAVVGLTNKDAKQEIKAIRGIEKPIDAEMPLVFRAKVQRGDTFHRVEVRADWGAGEYKAGVLSIRKDHWARWEERFGRFITYEE